MRKEDFKKWGARFVFALILIVVFKLLDNFSDITAWFSNLFSVLMPFFMALIVAYLFYLPCRKIEGFFKKSKSKILKKKARWLSILIVYLIALLVIILILRFVIPTVLESLGELISALPGYYDGAINKLQELPDDSIIDKESLISIIESLGEIHIEDYLSFETITEYAKSIIGVATGIFDVFVTIIVSIYILAERTEIVNFFKKLCNALFNIKVYKKLGKYFRESNEIFFKFISSQIFDGIIVRNYYLYCYVYYGCEICCIIRIYDRII